MAGWDTINVHRETWGFPDFNLTELYWNCWDCVHLDDLPGWDPGVVFHCSSLHPKKRWKERNIEQCALLLVPTPGKPEPHVQLAVAHRKQEYEKPSPTSKTIGVSKDVLLHIGGTWYGSKMWYLWNPGIRPGHMSRFKALSFAGRFKVISHAPASGEKRVLSQPSVLRVSLLGSQANLRFSSDWEVHQCAWEIRRLED